ncbi:MAG: glutathione S-transferase family protein [Methylococcales bacterium]
MITLYQFTPTWGIPNPGQFCVKLETYLRIAGIPYTVVETLPLKAPKGKLPFIEDDGQKITDSRFIIEHLKNKYGDSLDRDLNPKQRGIMTAMQRLLEEHLYWIGMYARWQYTDGNWQINKKALFGGLPPVIRNIAALAYRGIIRKQIYGQGTGRRNTDQIFHLGKIDLDALSAFLDSKPYFMGDKPTSLDASAFGILINTVRGPIESPVKRHGLATKNLPAYCDRMMAEFFPELVIRNGN